jgi:phenylpropionate dioxygenase-like ring-hydroxylating dioxygenase large terminal subunit
MKDPNKNNNPQWQCLVTQEKKLRSFWYAVIPISELSSGPKPFVLLGEKIVLWLDEAGKPAAAQDRCCHRSAKLSGGWVDQGILICPYHAWGFASTGQCVRVPQLVDRTIPKSHCIPVYHCKERYGYVWVCLEDPICDIPEFPEDRDPSYRRIHCFYETWNTSSPRVIENELDMAHFSVVHRNSFGNPDVPLPNMLELSEDGPMSFHLKAEISICARGQQLKNTGVATELSTRVMNITWFAPFVIRLRMTYPSGLNHVIINHPTPIDDSHIQVVQFHFRDDTDADVSVDEVLSFERIIASEDRLVLEGTSPELPLENASEAHMATDKAGIMFRKKLAKILLS